MKFALVACGTGLGLLWLAPARAAAASQFTVATYNLEGYVVAAEPGGRAPKSDAGRAKVHESLRTLKADVLAVQEVGGTNALSELRAALGREGLDYPYWEHVLGFDTNIQVAVLSRFPFTARRPHPNEGFLLYGRRFRVTRGFAEVEIGVGERYRFTLITAHLKSRRETGTANQADLREQEAIRLRQIIEARLKADPDLNLVVLGDLNDHPDSAPVRTVLGRGARPTLVDTRPAERNGDDAPNPVNPRFAPRHVSWTHFYGKEDVYSRIDYILLSPAMAREWDRAGSHVLALPNWGVGSDHRPVVARFWAIDK
jgi:endonuclease/exonuclease/phosphatase family metal-dependent hydrolase